MPTVFETYSSTKFDALMNGVTFFQPVAVRLSPESPVVQSSDVDEEESENQRLKMHRRLHGVGTRDVGYEQLWNAAKDEPGKIHRAKQYRSNKGKNIKPSLC